MRQLAHDLNNHIAALLSFAELVRDELPAQHALRWRIEAILTIGQFAVIRSLPDATLIEQVTDHVAQVRQLAYGALAAETDTRSPLYADLMEIAVAAESALAVVSVGARDAA